MTASKWGEVRSAAHRAGIVGWGESWDREVPARRLWPAPDATLMETDAGLALRIPTPPRERVYFEADGFLCYPRLLDGMGEGVDVEPNGILERFCRLADADPEDVLEYARTFGLLQTCEEHGLPFHHPRMGRKSERCWPAELEPLGAWREWSGAFRAVLAIRAQIGNGKPGRDGDWRRLGVPQPEDLDVEDARRLLGRTVDRFLMLADNRTVFAWDEGPTIQVGCHGLFQCLAWDLTLTVARVDGLAVCEGCREPYTRGGDVQRIRKYCGACRDAGVPARIRKRRQRGGDDG